jgi:cytochrome bd ubiquinol oxidase subunit I
MTFAGWIGVLSGWYTTEVGRQPFLVQDLLRTSEAVTTVSASNVGLTLALYMILYVVLITAYISVVFFLARRAGDTETKSSEPAALGPSVLTRSKLEPGHA